MASRDRNFVVWQAYVITLSIVSILLLGLLGYMFFAGATNSKMAQEAVSREEQKSQQLATQSSKVQLLKAIVGIEQYTDAEFENLKSNLTSDADVTTLLEKYETDMSAFGPEVAAQDRNYGRLGDYLLQAIRDRNAQIDSSAKQLEAKNVEVEQIRETETTARQAAEAKSDDLAKKLSETEQRLVDQSNDHQTKLDELSSNLAKTTKNYEDQIKTATAEISSLKQQLTETIAVNRDLRKQIQKDVYREDSESAFAKVTNVERQGNIAFINAGRKQGIRQGLLFSVYRENTIRISEAKPKATIEVTKVLDNLSQVRVIQDRFSTPIVPNDLVHSSTWSPSGRPREYVLLGRMDIDNNGSDDRERIIAMIEENGGLVVEDLGPDGQLRQLGEGLSVNTSFLVLGDRGDVTNIPDERTNRIQSAYGALEKRANEVGLVRISLDRLVGELRKYADDQLIPLGDGIRSGDFGNTNRIRFNKPSPNQAYQNRQRERFSNGLK